MAADGLKCTVKGLKACTTYVARAVLVAASAPTTALATSPVSSYMMTLSEKVRLGRCRRRVGVLVSSWAGLESQATPFWRACFW